ncbi:MAG: GNAT family N-acetyltransferase [Actinomycetota bacterium]|nr:GNAT family N-acetyltransferase [Actinomycetota bacterium]
MKESVRAALSTDLETLVEFATQAVAEQDENRGGYIWSGRETRNSPYFASFEATLHDPDQIIWMGMIDEVPVGYAVSKVELLRSGEILGQVSDIWVEPQARSVGVGEALIEAIISWCTERNCVGIDSMALPGNRATKNFFETFGFKARLLTVHKPLTEP